MKKDKDVVITYKELSDAFAKAGYTSTTVNHPTSRGMKCAGAIIPDRENVFNALAHIITQLITEDPAAAIDIVNRFCAADVQVIRDRYHKIIYFPNATVPSVP